MSDDVSPHVEALPLLFVAGVPSTGKTHYGRWLEAEHRYIHVDAEIPGELERLDLRDVWDATYATQDCALLASVLRSRGRPAVFNWGFPPACLPIVAAFKNAGFSCWWFDGDPVAARREHLRLGKSTEAFDLQLAGIRTAEVAAHFAPNIVSALSSSGDRVSPPEILRRMRSAG